MIAVHHAKGAWRNQRGQSRVHARRAAASALAALSTAEAREALVRAGTTDPDPDVRRICATVLLAT